MARFRLPYKSTIADGLASHLCRSLDSLDLLIYDQQLRGALADPGCDWRNSHQPDKESGPGEKSD
jgi:hypothetical protein